MEQSYLRQSVYQSHKKATVAARKLNVPSHLDSLKVPLFLETDDLKEEDKTSLSNEKTNLLTDGDELFKFKNIHEKTKSLSINISPKVHSIKLASLASLHSNEVTKYALTPEYRTKTLSKVSDPFNNFETFMKRLTRLQLNSVLPNAEPTKYSEKTYGIVKGFGICTNQGLVRNYNEDRVSILLNIHKVSDRPSDDEYWPTCSLFGVFDGHGGSKCVDFIRHNLHNFIAKSKYFPSNPQEALREGFEEVEKAFTQEVLSGSSESPDKSGSCALVMLFVDDTCYVCNLGDSRAILSQNSGNSIFPLTRDHKPCDKQEQKRILDAGGKVYQNSLRQPLNPNSKGSGIAIPYRIFPGKLSVSRAFGDIPAKLPQFGGNPNVLIAKPEITKMKVSKEHDFIILGCDGLFDKLTNEEISKAVWDCIDSQKSSSLHESLGLAAENVVKSALFSKSLDNVTCIIVSFANLEAYFNNLKTSNIKKESLSIVTSSGMEDYNTLNSNSLSVLPSNLSPKKSSKHISGYSRIEYSKFFKKDIQNESDASGLQLGEMKFDPYSERSPKGFLPSIKSPKNVYSLLATHK